VQYRSDKEIVEILADAIKMFNDLLPEQRRQVRRKNRRRRATEFVERLEMRYDIDDMLS
jgi:hypothetical protein